MSAKKIGHNTHFSFRYVNCVGAIKEKKPKKEQKICNITQTNTHTKTRRRKKTMDMTPAQLLYKFMGSTESNTFEWPKHKLANKCLFLIGFLFLFIASKTNALAIFQHQLRIEFSVNRPLVCIAMNNRRWIPSDNTFYYTYWTPIQQNDKYLPKIFHSIVMRPFLLRKHILFTFLPSTFLLALWCFSLRASFNNENNKTQSIYHTLQITGQKMSSFLPYHPLFHISIVYDRRLCR